MTFDSTLRQRFLDAEPAFLLAIRAGPAAIDEFYRKWALLRSDLEKAIKKSSLEDADVDIARITATKIATIAEDFSYLEKKSALLCTDLQKSSLEDVDLARTTATKIAIITEDLSYLEKKSASMTSNLLNDLESLFAELTFTDMLPSSPVVSFVTPSLPHATSDVNIPLPYIAPAFAWLLSNVHDPYPSKVVRRMLSKESGVSLHTLNEWFRDARRQIGWLALCKDRFRGCRAIAVETATSVFVREAPSVPLAPAVVIDFLAIQSRLENLFRTPVRGITTEPHPVSVLTRGQPEYSHPTPSVASETRNTRSASRTPSLTWSSDDNESEDNSSEHDFEWSTRPHFSSLGKRRKATEEDAARYCKRKRSTFETLGTDEIAYVNLSSPCSDTISHHNPSLSPEGVESILDPLPSLLPCLSQTPFIASSFETSFRSPLSPEGLHSKPREAIEGSQRYPSTIVSAADPSHEHVIMPFCQKRRLSELDDLETGNDQIEVCRTSRKRRRSDSDGQRSQDIQHHVPAFTSHKRRLSVTDNQVFPKRPCGLPCGPRSYAVSDPLPRNKVSHPEATSFEWEDWFNVNFQMPNMISTADIDISQPFEVELFKGWDSVDSLELNVEPGLCGLLPNDNGAPLPSSTVTRAPVHNTGTPETGAHSSSTISLLDMLLPEAFSSPAENFSCIEATDTSPSPSDIVSPVFPDTPQSLCESEWSLDFDPISCPSADVMGPYGSISSEFDVSSILGLPSKWGMEDRHLTGISL